MKLDYVEILSFPTIIRSRMDAFVQTQTEAFVRHASKQTGKNAAPLGMQERVRLSSGVMNGQNGAVHNHEPFVPFASARAISC